MYGLSEQQFRLFFKRADKQKGITGTNLLRLLETSEFTRIGSQESTAVDVRVIAATNADLVNEIRLGHFREDLYYRLDVLNIEMPPLRERNGDIPLLVSHFIKEACDDFKKKIRGISSDFINCVESYPWPGNVREMKNVIDRYRTIGSLPLQDALPQPLIPADDEPLPKDTADLPHAMDDYEKRLITTALERCRWKYVRR